MASCKNNFFFPLFSDTSLSLSYWVPAFLASASVLLLLLSLAPFNRPFDTRLEIRAPMVASGAIKAFDSRLAENSSGGIDGCDIFDGRWVEDGSGPLYAPGSCPFIDDSFDCFKNGRPDSEFVRLRWRPRGCAIPRCAASEFTLIIFLFSVSDYNCSIEFFRSPFLVQEWETKEGKETLRLDVIDQASSDKYRNADFIVFNTGHWWTHEKTSLGKGYYQEGKHVHDTLSVVEAYARALHTWANWVDSSIRPNLTRVFFRGFSATHFKGGQWNSGGSCNGETQPIYNDTQLGRYPKMMSILEETIGGMQTPVYYLNITRMSDYRKDGHPSVFRHPQKGELRGQDCSHWCLPGVPDAWNELLYAAITSHH
ncbi:hypothetical protein QJS04_geneDACA008907 [Acorus gramineus]|uniref:Trichome birefringence-like N-terminal domain-containing protein n=1 Tax=Acorus gramineus TaxID=55184 RepID=A0AAV9ACU7_ACOGR|nr:hypothetical protein QJS04_geneDACA008907 [Acorus gramineus]